MTSNINSQRLETKKQLNDKITKRFNDKRLFVVLLRFIIPSIFVSFFSALYIFIDQIMIVKFVIKSDLNPASIFDNNYFNFVDSNNQTWTYNDYVKASKNLNVLVFNINDLIRASISISAPITVIINALTLLITMGMANQFSKALGSGNEAKIKEVWSTGFTTNLVVSIASSLIIVSVARVWLTNSANGSMNNMNAAFDVNSVDGQIVSRFFARFKELQINNACNYVYVLAGLFVIQSMNQMYFLLNQAEGRQLFISIIPPLANIINIIFDYLLIRFTNSGIAAAAYATVIGWGLNCLAYLTYNILLIKKNETYLVYQGIFKKANFNWNYLYLIFLIGLASFFRNAALSISNAIFQTNLVSVTEKIQPNLPPNYYQSIFGSITPISNLMLQSVWGLINGGRTVAGYKFGQRNFNDITKIYWYVPLIAFCYSIIVYLTFIFGLNNVFLNGLFNIEDYDKLIIANIILKITLVQSIFIALSMNAQLLFQSTQRIGMAWISSLMQGLFTFVPVFFTMYYLSINENNIYLYIWIQPINAILACLCNWIISIPFAHKYREFVSKYDIGMLMKKYLDKNNKIEKK
ncbi:MATE family efflux transporter [Mycoplasma bradburyae]|uniref:MATE family efflux transporter n=1 Tax=Mycoplasma bradburyae TaxID=2963128 RepID=UPI00234010D2|nr:MATE family efflux transporter [Mycoplasma bradburyae]MDC4182869.1 MATE family efflux transporter [Mycoplasma bradburyae]